MSSACTDIADYAAPTPAATPVPAALAIRAADLSYLRMVLILGTLVALGPLTIDLYLPALPAIVTDLQTTAAAVQLTLTGTLAGLATGQLVVGPLSDALGRRRPLFAGVGVHVLASLLCVVAPNLAVLGALRFLQGFGSAAASVVAMAVVRDLFAGRTAATLFSRLMLVLGVAPVFAPTIGGQVLRWTEWRGVFVVLALIGAAITAMAIRMLPETLPPHRRTAPGVAATLRNYRSLFTDRGFVGLCLVAGLAMATVFAYVAGSPFVYQEQFGLDPQAFGLLFGAGGVGMILVTQLNVRLLRRWQPRQVLVAGLAIAGVSSMVLLALALLSLGGLPGVAVPLWVVLTSLGLVMPNLPALAMARHGDAAGTAAAMLGAVQSGIGAVAAPLVGALGSDAVAVATVVAGGIFLGGAVLAVVVRPRELADL